MSKILLEKSYLTGIANAIRNKLEVLTLYKPSQMEAAIESIIKPSGTKQVTISQNGTITEDVESYKDAAITVNVPQPSGTKQITSNGTYDVTNYSNAIVNVSGGGSEGGNISSGIDVPTSNVGLNGDIYLQYIEGTDMFGTPSSNSPEGASISATSQYSIYHAYKAFGNQEGWGASGSNGTLTYSFTSGTFKPIQLSFVDYFDVSGGYLKANTFTFEASNDGTNWDTLYTKSESATTKDDLKTVSINTQNSYSKFRFVVNGGTGYAGIKKVLCIADSSASPINKAYCKVNGAWQNLIGTDINDVNTSGSVG